MRCSHAKIIVNYFNSFTMFAVPARKQNKRAPPWHWLLRPCHRSVQTVVKFRISMTEALNDKDTTQNDDEQI